MPRDYEGPMADESPVNAVNARLMDAAKQAQTEVSKHYGYGNKLGDVGGAPTGVAYGTASTRMTADMILQEKIAALYHEINGLKALRAALPREMGFEADAAFWKLLIK